VVAAARIKQHIYILPNVYLSTLFVVDTTVSTTAQYRDPAQLVSIPE
jgi:hypothetical protein